MRKEVDIIKEFFPNSYIVMENDGVKTVEIVDDEIDNFICTIEDDVIDIDVSGYNNMYLNRYNLEFLLNLLDNK